jgi:hypothetical protein
MSKECGPSKAALDLDAKIGGAMDTVKDSFIGSAAGGIADGIAGLKSGLTGLTDGIVAEIEKAIPKIELPKATLQQQMTKMMSSLDNPGAFLSEFEDIKKNFGGSIDIDKMVKEAGVDPNILNSFANKASASTKQATDALGTFKDGKATDLTGSLGKLAAGDLSAIKDFVGEMPSVTLPGFEIGNVLSSICTSVPNLELDKDGNIIKKGVETKLPSQDGAKIEKAEAKNDPPPPQKEPAPADRLENGTTVILNPDTEEAQKIEREYGEDIQAVKPLLVIILERQAKFYENRQKIRDLTGVFRTSEKNKQKQRELYLENIRNHRRNKKDILYNELRMKNWKYIRDDKLYEADLIKKKPIKPVISWEEIHERTYFSNYPKTIDLILQIPNLEIKGERPERVIFGAKGS